MAANVEPARAPHEVESNALAGTVTYIGSITRKEDRAWVYGWPTGCGGKQARVTFSDSKHGGKDKALEAARAFQVQKARELGRIRVLPTLDTNDVSENEAQYAAGLWDGDGNISMNDHNQSVYTGVAQTCSSGTPPVLRWLKQRYGGYIHDKKAYGNQRPPYVWRSYGKNARLFLTHMERYSILKRQQATLGLRVLESKTAQDRDALAHQLHSSKKLSEYRKVVIDKSRLCDAYLAGFFDAEGCVSLNDSGHQLMFTQKSSPSLLYAIKEYLDGIGCVHGKTFAVFTAPSAAAVLDRIKRFSIVKKSQMDVYASHLSATLERWLTRGKHARLTVEEKAERTSRVSAAKRLKRA